MKLTITQISSASKLYTGWKVKGFYHRSVNRAQLQILAFVAQLRLLAVVQGQESYNMGCRYQSSNFNNTALKSGTKV